MKKNNLSLKETFKIALENYRKKNFSTTENLCKKILSIDSNHYDSLVLLSNIFAGICIKSKLNFLVILFKDFKV